MQAYLAAAHYSAMYRLRSRTTMGLDAIVLIKFVVVLGALWRAATAANGGNLSGYTYSDLVWYVVGAETVVSSVTSRLIEHLGDDIGRGDIATEMIRPVSLVGVRFSRHYGESAVRAGAGLAGASVVAALLSGRWPGALDAVMAAASISIGLALHLMMHFAFAGIAFWLLDAKAGWFLFQKLTFLFGGLFIPLELMPEGISAVVRWLPFGATTWIPGRFLSGHGTPGLLAFQVVWLIVIAAITVAIFERGQRRVQVGG